MLVSFGISTFAKAELLVSPEKALGLKYGPDVEITKKNISITEAQLKELIKKVQAPLESKVYTFYIIESKSDKKTIGYGALLTDTVRAHNQTVLFYLTPDGGLDGAELIAYYEPPEYKVSSEWMNKNLKGKTQKSPLKPGDDLPVVTGSTLTIESLSRLSRLALALWQIPFEKSKPTQ
ncbi:MAG: hypothetical protein KDD34_08360 [Bdellovibrionales bacterium]|nr:hypothetical protein [Bdellovibrionales bacterium]